MESRLKVENELDYGHSNKYGSPTRSEADSGIAGFDDTDYNSLRYGQRPVQRYEVKEMP
jgi:hypothetical protein